MRAHKVRLMCRAQPEGPGQAAYCPQLLPKAAPPTKAGDQRGRDLGDCRLCFSVRACVCARACYRLPNVGKKIRGQLSIFWVRIKGTFQVVCFTLGRCEVEFD